MTASVKDGDISLLAVGAMADALVAAYGCSQIPPLSYNPGALDNKIAHDVRDATIRRWREAGRRIVGRKIGLTSEVTRARLGAPEPTDGYLFADTEVASGGVVDREELFQPLVEAEVALIVGRDIVTLPDGPDDLRAAIGGAVAAIEIVDSRVEGWRITYADAISDNGSAAGFVVAQDVRSFEDIDNIIWEMKREGASPQGLSGASNSAAILRNFRWLAGKAISVGAPLRRGEIVLSGSLGGAIPVSAGDTLSVGIARLGTCRVSFR